MSEQTQPSTALRHSKVPADDLATQVAALDVAQLTEAGSETFCAWYVCNHCFFLGAKTRTS